MKISGYTLILIMIFAINAQGDYQIVRSTIDGGGGQSSNGIYKLVGTIGQPDAGSMGGGQYELLGGFWPSGPSCIVNFYDFSIFANYWLEKGIDLPADLDESGAVNNYDLELFSDNWLCRCPYNWPLRKSYCVVDFGKFSKFAEYWLQSGASLPADLDNSGKVDIYDLKLFVDKWLCTCPADWQLK